MEISIATVFLYYVFKAAVSYPTVLVCVYPSPPPFLHNDFSVFGASSHTAFTFKEFAQFFQIVFRTDKSGNESYNFTAPVLAVQLYAQTLLGRLESGLLFFIVQFVFEVGVG